MKNKQVSYTYFHRRLQQWYDANGRRDLPWRNTSDAYAIYISEIMLQQTQVKTVLERYYAPFLNKFPTLASLAAASEKEVLKSWQGLGYYNRAINLHQAAKQCKNRLPQTLKALQALPGIGRNTAHAVAAFAYHQPVAVMEANVKRVLCRIFALNEANDNELWQKATELLNQRNPYDYNQAMMDIGSMVCTKRAPKCGQCPANDICKGKHAPELFPMAKQKKAVQKRHKIITVYRSCDGKYHATPRKSRFLNGLYHFNEIAAPEKPSPQAKPLGSITQQYSHFTLEAEVYLFPNKKISGKNWHTFTALKKLPMSMAEQKILKWL